MRKNERESMFGGSIITNTLTKLSCKKQLYGLIFKVYNKFQIEI